MTSYAVVLQADENRMSATTLQADNTERGVASRALLSSTSGVEEGALNDTVALTAILTKTMQ